MSRYRPLAAGLALFASACAMISSVRAFAAGPEDAIGALAVSPAGRFLAASKNGRIMIIDHAANRLAANLGGHRDRITALAFSPDGTLLLSGSRDRTARVWARAGTGGEWTFRRALKHEGEVTGVTAVRGADIAVIGTWDGTLVTWRLQDGRRLESAKGHLFGEVRLAAGPSPGTFASGGDDQTLRLWSAAPLRQRAMLTDGRWGIKAHKARVMALRFAGRTLVTIGYDTRYAPLIRAWDPAAGKALSGLSLDRRSFPKILDGRHVADFGSDGAFDVAPDGRLAAFVSAHPARPIMLADLAAGRIAGTFAGRVGANAEIAFLPGGKTLALGTTDGEIFMVDLKTGALGAGMLAGLGTAPFSVEGN